MPGVSADDVRHVARLARLGITDAAAHALARDLSTILEHMEILAAVDTEAVAQAAGVGAAGMRLDPDHGPPLPLAEPPESFAPAMRDGFFLVPRLASHGNTEQGAEP